MDLAAICKQVIKTVEQTGLYIKEEGEKFSLDKVETKEKGSLVSYVDRESENMLGESLQKLLPEAGIIAEEGFGEKAEELNWVIDPVDGTTNFTHQLPYFCVSVGLVKNDVPILGVVYDIAQGDIYYAWKGSGAFCNQKQIYVQESSKTSDSLMATGYPYFDNDKMQEYLKLLNWCIHNTHGVRRMGSAALDIVYTARGRFGAFFEYGLKPWDIAGGSIILREAGGFVSDFEGNEDFLFKKTFLGSSKIHKELLKIIQNFWFGS